ncbi:MAG: hypothetical protein JNL23_07425 [Chitinophagaceae bacterium]|nr:hypothetical protein [Chitinophagaceae bacterium]
MMRKIKGIVMLVAASAMLAVVIYSCNKDDDGTNDNIRSKEYTLAAVNSSGVSGKVTITENTDKSFNVLVNIDNSVKDTVHPLHIHNGSVNVPGNIAIPLSSITGTGGAAQSLTSNINSVTWPDSTVHVITYDSIIQYNGYLNVHYSAYRMDSLISQGNIGIN